MPEKPWNDLPNIPAEIYVPKGMLGPEERRMLFWATNRDYTGQGAIIDAGAFLGASAYALASGLECRAGDSAVAASMVHSYDYFKVVDAYVGDFITREFRHAGPDTDYLDIFQRQLGALSGRVVTYPDDFLRHRWTGQPVELLFIDISKTLELNSHVIAEFFACLIPGRSLVIQQDFYHAWHPYIHVTMQALKPYFEIIDGLVQYQSRVYRLIAPIPAADLDRAIRYDYTPTQCYDLLEELAAESVSPIREMARVLRLQHISINGDKALFAAEWSGFVAAHDLTSQELWAVEARRVREAAPI